MRTNWAGNVRFRAHGVHHPPTVRELQGLVASTAKIRALGTGHSFNRIADTTGHQVSLAALPPEVEIDHERAEVRVGGSLRYSDVAPLLADAGLALRNTGSLPHISVAGACATGTHGSGIANQTLSAAVRSLTMVTGGGDLVTLDRSDDDFAGCVVALGRLGVVVSQVLEAVPAFDIAQTVVEDVPDEAVADQLVDVLSAGYSVSVFTDWGAERLNQVWVKERPDRAGGWAGQPLWGGRIARRQRHPVAGMPADRTTPQLGLPGPWHQRLPHFRSDRVPSSGAELQSEYLLPAEHGTAAWQALSSLRRLVHPLLQVCEIRAVAGDDHWLGLTGGTASIAFHFTWRPDPEAVRPILPKVEQQLAPFGARPHWGKLFATAPDTLAGLYPRMPDFRRLVAELDPAGTFGNDAVDEWIGLG